MRRFLAFFVVIALVAAVLTSLWIIDPLAFTAGLGAIAVFGLSLLIPAARRRTRNAVTQVGLFASSRDGHTLCGYPILYTNLGNAANLTPERLSRVFTDAGWRPENLHVVLWIIHRSAEHTWALVRQEHGLDSRWTATVDGPLADEDHTLEGMLDPFAGASRLAKTQIDLPISNVHFLSWGIERDTSRAVLVGWAETDVPPHDLLVHRYTEPAWSSHLADLRPEKAARAIGWAGSAQWRAGALYGLARMVEEAGGLRRLERDLNPRWSNTIGHVR